MLCGEYYKIQTLGMLKKKITEAFPHYSENAGELSLLKNERSVL